ncbi:TRAP transporter substrate-binding protein [Halanaerobaculum tunisiense]
MKFLTKRIMLVVAVLSITVLLSGVASAGLFGGDDETKKELTVKMSYNGPANAEKNPVHGYAQRLKNMVESRSNGRIKISLFANSQLGNEQQRMEQTMNGPMINIASNAGMVSVSSEVYAATVPFMFKNYKAAHIFFGESKYWKKLKEKFRKKTGIVLLEAIEEGGFLAFTNSKRPIHSPKDFKGLKFRAMDAGQVALYESFGASGTPIPWTETYMALQTGVANGQMNPPTYIISGSLYEVQDYMTLANVQYSCQFLTINEALFESLSTKDRKMIKQAAYEANVANRREVENKVKDRIKFIKNKGVKVYKPTVKELNSFQKVGQQAYIAWIKEKLDQKWIDLALESAKKANQEAIAHE